MNQINELKWNELKLSYQPSDFSFTTTNELVGSHEIIGQEQAKRALEMGLRIKAKGYNLYVCGDCGVGKLSCIMHQLTSQAKEATTPPDLCYTYNFKMPEMPKLLLLHAGDGIKFKEDMDELIEFIRNELPLKLQTLEVNKKRQSILDAFEEKKQALIADLSTASEKVGILVKLTKDGIGFAPLGSKGQGITKEEYNQLPVDERKNLDQKLAKLYTLADEILMAIDEKEEQCVEELEDIDKEVVLYEIGSLLKYLKEKYKDYAQIKDYLDEVGEDILSHMEAFVPKQEDKGKEVKEIFPWLGENDREHLVKHYRINVLVDNSQTQGAPIITSRELDSTPLNGKILMDTEMNVLRSDFMTLRPGLLHKANGGYLILEVQSLLNHVGSWEALKRVLKSGKIVMESSEDTAIGMVSSVRPEPVAANIKVILLGNYYFYRTLYEYDPDFKKLFKKRIDFERELKNSKEIVSQLACLIKEISDTEKLPPLTSGALVKLCEYGNRHMQDPKKLPANLEMLLDVVREASLYDKEVIDEQCITMALEQRQLFIKSLEEKLDEQILGCHVLIDTQGERIGTINGLAIYTVDNCLLGRPTRITATTYRGKKGIIDIEKESGLSGEIHSKGVQIITGFLGQHFAQDMPLSLNCSLCFEQSYGGIDGDSASSAELYAILSSLSELPIKQHLGVTGSVNQFGQIQPIGGVNEKIEGFYAICKKRGLQGNEGVIIPKQNVKDLLLKDEIIESVKNNEFHIYAITNIEEGIELLTNTPYEECKKRVLQKLKRYNDLTSRN
ncbi:ATP-dependent protease [Sporanaerobium hydrogeniformans]|uniref:ATP-dependent protease n=1 Tax=Sporanaerobium hydrogeniformans TaxID=3072179 RepID=A0AC61DH52_9FIRM|nr:ATP-binding protein [Sporanaerobium hydrogeniformans]PHV72026.1 ATP-dependent protease [Sporanaerobium hydrogeniformans]